MHTHTLVIVQLMSPGIIGMFIIHSFIQCQYTYTRLLHTHTRSKRCMWRRMIVLVKMRLFWNSTQRSKTDHTPSRRLSNQLEYQCFVWLFTSYNMFYIWNEYFLLVNLYQKFIVMWSALIRMENLLTIHWMVDKIWESTACHRHIFQMNIPVVPCIAMSCKL